MLFLITDCIEPWLVYIWEQFVQINKLKTEYRITTYGEYENGSFSDEPRLILEYSIEQKYPQSLFIPKKNHFKTDDYVWIKKDLPVFADTVITTSGVTHYDIFYNAFVHLSRLEEWLSEQQGKLIHSYAFKHPRKDRSVWKIPVVNFFFNALEEKIKNKFPGVLFEDHKKPVIEFSHDVDYIRKTMQLRAKQGAFHFYNAFKFFFQGAFKQAFACLGKGIDFAISRADYWCFDYWADLEKQYKTRSVFYIYAGTGRKNMVTWLMDPSYNVGANPVLAGKLKSLVKDGFEVGLHGSFKSAVDGKTLKREKRILEKAIQNPVVKVRQHWLRYQEKITPYLHDALFQFDSTVGWNDQIGFRSGCGSRYNPYDHRNQRPFKYLVTPQVVMDSTLFDYGRDNLTQEVNNGLTVLLSLNRVKNACASISWHQRVSSSDYSWSGIYVDFLKVHKEQLTETNQNLQGSSLA